MPSPLSEASPVGPTAEQQYAQLIASLDGIVWEADARTFQMTFVSEPAERLLGYPPARWLEPNFWSDHVHPDDRAWALEFCGRATREMRPHDFEYRMIAADGRVVWLRDLVTVVAEGGAPRTLRGIMVDVTGKKRAEEALRASEARLDAAQRMAHVAWWERDFATGRSLRSPESYRIFGLPPQEWEDLAAWERQWRGLIHPDDRERTTEGLRRAVEGGPRYDLEYRIVRATGEVRVIHSQGDVTRGADGRPLRMFGTMQDITALRLAERGLRASEARFRTLVDHAADAFFLMDARATLLDVNRQACQSLGYAHDELIGKTPLDFDLAVDQAALDTMLARLEGGEDLAFDTRHRRKDGTVFPVEIRIRSFWEGGKRFALALARDITDRKRLEGQFRQAQKMEAVGRLAGGVAHDFNNLLTVINGHCALVLAGLPTGDPNRASVAAVLDAGERAARLTRQLLAFSRKAVVEPKVLDLNELVTQTGRLLRALIGEDIILTVTSDPTLGAIKADPGQLEQVILNLAVNARDAMPTGGRLTLETRAVTLAAAPPGRAPGRYARLLVSDSGCGMTDVVKANVFEPFFTTKGVGKGTGLGLAVVHGVVEGCGGWIEVESAVGVGTTFTVSLPVTEETGPWAPAPADADVAGGRETILLVEDEGAVRTIARHALEMQGYAVLEADGGAAAVARVAAHPGGIDLLVSDVVMPEMGGRQLLERLRAIRHGLPVLFMSGHTDDAVLLHGVVGERDAFIQKPFTPLALARKVREVLDAARPVQKPDALDVGMGVRVAASDN